MNDILYNWEACMSCGFSSRRRVVPWAPPSLDMLKFNVDGVARGKSGSAGIGGCVVLVF